MYVNDPHEKALAPKSVSEILEQEPRDYHDFFYDDLPGTSQRYASGFGVQSQVCRFDEFGDHSVIAKNCPHYEAEDEEGKRIIPGWTVQQSR